MLTVGVTRFIFSADEMGIKRRGKKQTKQRLQFTFYTLYTPVSFTFTFTLALPQREREREFGRERLKLEVSYLRYKKKCFFVCPERASNLREN